MPLYGLSMEAHDALRANLPLFPICGESKGDHQRKPLEEALSLPYLQLSGKARLKGKVHLRLTCIVLDLDGKHWQAHDFRDLDLPPPDFVIHNPDKPSTHAIWVFAFPVWVPIGAKARPFSSSRQPWELYLAVEAYLVEATRADRSLRTLKVKNPWSDEHRTTWTRAGHARTLNELVQWIPERKLEPVVIELKEDASRGRNVALFGRALRVAGELARKVGQGIDDLTEALYNVGDQLNDFLEPLPVGEVRSTLRSAARYASSWTLRSEGTPGGRRAVQGLSPEEVKERQSAAAFRTNEMRKSRTLEELIRVVGLMAADGATMTKAAVVRASGMAWHSVNRVWDVLMAHCNTVSLYTVPAITGEDGLPHGQLEAGKAPVDAQSGSGSDSPPPVDSLPDAPSPQTIPASIPVSACALSNFPPKTVTKGDITVAFTRENFVDNRLGFMDPEDFARWQSVVRGRRKAAFPSLKEQIDMDAEMECDRPTTTSVLLHAHRLATGETVEATHLEFVTGQIVGPGWLGVRIDGGEWLPVEGDPLRLVLDLRLCRTVEDVQALIVDGAEARDTQ